MADLHETSDLKYAAQIDGVGWMFVAFVVVIHGHRSDGPIMVTTVNGLRVPYRPEGTTRTEDLQWASFAKQSHIT